MGNGNPCCAVKSPDIAMGGWAGSRLKTLTNMPRTGCELVMSKIDVLARDPVGAANIENPVGAPGCRSRVGDWRVLFDVESGRLVVRVLKIGQRERK